MATTTVTGSEWLNQVSDSTANIPFRKFLTFGALPNENWDSQTYDPDTGKIAFGFKNSLCFFIFLIEWFENSNESS